MGHQGKYELELFEIPDVSNLKGFTPDQIDVFLARLPISIRYYGEQLIEAQEGVDIAKNDLARELAKAHLEASTKREELGLSSDADRKAWAKMQDNVEQAEIMLVNARKDLAMAQLRVNQAENMFVSVRKAASIYEKLLKSDDDRNRYDDIPDNMQ